MTPRTWAWKQAEKELTAKALDGSPITWAAHLLNKQHARSVRIVKAEIKRVKMDRHNYSVVTRAEMTKCLDRLLAALQKGRT